MMSLSRSRSSIISSLKRLGLCFSMEKWKGLRPGFQNYLYFLKKKENGECIFQMNLNYSNDWGPMYLRKLQYPLTSMKKTIIFIQIILKYAFTIFLFLRNTDNFESHSTYAFHFFILKSLCRERMIRDLPLDHDIMSALTITEIFHVSTLFQNLE